jgi:hypothetical protein
MDFNEVELSKLTKRKAEVFDEILDKPALVDSKRFDMESVKISFNRYHQAIKEMGIQAQEYKIGSEESLKGAVAMAGQVKSLFKEIEDQRKATVSNPNKFVKSVNGFVKEFTSKLGRIETVLKSKIGQYQYQRELERREAERKAQEEAEALQKRLDEEAKERGVEPIKVETPVIPKDESVARAETGASAHVRKQWKGEILDPGKVPRTFCSPDMVKINEAIRAGIREIPGVKIYEDISTVLRT